MSRKKTKQATKRLNISFFKDFHTYNKDTVALLNKVAVNLAVKYSMNIKCWKRRNSRRRVPAYCSRPAI